MPWAAAGAVVGGVIAAQGAKDAAGAGAGASKAQIREARRQYDQTRSDFEPFRQTGLSANSRLSYLLGLSPSGGGSSPQLTYDQLRKELESQYTTQGQGDASYEYDPYSGEMQQVRRPTQNVDQTGLDAAITARLAQQAQQQAQQQAAASGDPNYGSLMRKFSAEDLEADPVYQSGLKFGLDQGTGQINARASALGQYDSGATLKAHTRYASDYGSTKANESYNRYNTDNTNIYNRLAGVSGAGQTATGQVASAGANASNQIGGALSDMGNARAAGIVGGANAWGNALNTGINTYQNQQYLNMLKGQGGGGGGFGTGAAYGNQDYGSYL